MTSGGVPTVALLLMTIPSIIMAALYAYTPIDAEKGVTIVKLFTYDATRGHPHHVPRLRRSPS